jgi:hypothetical protein
LSPYPSSYSLGAKTISLQSAADNQKQNNKERMYMANPEIKPTAYSPENAEKTSNFRMGESSNFTPAVCFHNGQFHMVFAAANNTNELLHSVSGDGLTWTRKNNLGQSTKQAPAIASIHGKLVCVFVANNETNDLLSVVWLESDDRWTDNTTTRDSSKAGPTLAVTQIGLTVYFIANNPSNDILIQGL